MNFKFKSSEKRIGQNVNEAMNNQNMKPLCIKMYN